MLIGKKTLEYSADLARIKTDQKKEEKLLKDLEEILAYFEELRTLDTSNVELMTGGTNLNNVFREDEPGFRFQVSSFKLIGDFPEKENGFLKVPPVFE